MANIKKKHINLLITKENYRHYEEIFIKIRYSAIILSIIVFLTSIFYLLALRNQNQTIDKLNSIKINNINLLNNNKMNEATLLTFNQKAETFLKFEKEDVNFLPYYNLLISSLPKSEATPQAILSKFKINKNREANFELIFNDSDHVLKFFSYVESDLFKKQFEKLVLNNFSLIKDTSLYAKQSPEKKYVLEFLATFKPINEN